MKVVHVIQRYAPAIGGSEVWCENVAEYLADKGVNTVVATMQIYHEHEYHCKSNLQESQARLGAREFRNGVSILRYRPSRFSDPGWKARLANTIINKTLLQRQPFFEIIARSPHSLEMYKALDSVFERCDVVHLHTLPYFHNLVAFRRAKKLGRRVIITPHFHPEHPHYEKSIMYKLMSQCDGVLAMSELEQRWLTNKGVPKDKISIVGNSIKLSDHARGDEYHSYIQKLIEDNEVDEKSCFKILFLGRKVPYKGLQDLMDASDELSKRGLDRQIVLILAGPSVPETADIKGLPQNSRVKLIDEGVVSEEEKDYLLKWTDVLALPSQYEAFGIVFLEAWKYKKPVIGCNVGAVEEVIRGAGLPVEHGDVVAITNSLSTLMNDSALATQLGEAGHTRLKEMYSQEKVGGKVLDMYRKVLNKKPRVLVVSQLFPPNTIGGADIVAYKHSKRLNAAGFEVHVFAGRKNNLGAQYKLTKSDQKMDVQLINLHDRDFASNYANINKSDLQAKFRTALKEISPDVVMFHNIYAFSLGMVNDCHEFNIPMLMTLHDYWGICSNNTLIDLAKHPCDRSGADCVHCRSHLTLEDGIKLPIEERGKLFVEGLNKVDVLISPSHYLMSKYQSRGVHGKKFIVLNNGIELNRFPASGRRVDKSIRFGFIGQIIAHKGLHILIESLKYLNKSDRKRITVEVIGKCENDYLDACKKLTKEYEIESLLKYSGLIPNKKIKKAYGRIDALIVPSIWPENSPVTIMEAFACATPVLGSNAGGIPELVKDKVTGFLHEPHDARQLARNIEKILADPSCLKSMGAACRTFVEQYDMDRQVDTLALEMEGLLGL